MRYPVSKTGGLRPWGFDSLSFRFGGGMAEWKGSALLPRGRLGRSAGSNPAASAFRSDVVERQDARLLIARRRFDSCHRSYTPPWSNGL